MYAAKMASQTAHHNRANISDGINSFSLSLFIQSFSIFRLLNSIFCLFACLFDLHLYFLYTVLFKSFYSLS
jgi:hypothetical protein